MYEYKIKSIKSIYDGGTFIARVDLGFGVVKEEKFRLAFIDTPELKEKNGKYAKQWLIKKLEKGLKKSTVIVKTNKDRKGKYSRYIAEIFINNKSVNQEMIDLEIAKKY